MADKHHSFIVGLVRFLRREVQLSKKFKAVKLHKQKRSGNTEIQGIHTIKSNTVVGYTADVHIPEGLCTGSKPVALGPDSRMKLVSPRGCWRWVECTVGKTVVILVGLRCSHPSLLRPEGRFTSKLKFCKNSRDHLNYVWRRSKISLRLHPCDYAFACSQCLAEISKFNHIINNCNSTQNNPMLTLISIDLSYHSCFR